ncbi:MAG: hypothetical protein L3J20_09575 [Flavobacteriaceae bacterium]|nr:hypothetical protein [Flavobacteriaceae bacterium]
MYSEIFLILISLLIGFLMGYLTSYFKEKGKNRALIEDLEKMTNEREKVSSKYQLDISKRKYKYEDKRTQYFKYFNLLDEFNTEGIQKAQIEFMPTLNKFNKNFLAANGSKKKELKATSDFSNSVNKIMFESNKSLLKLKQETNTIKLIAGDKVLKILKELEEGYDTSMEKSAQMMKGLSRAC